jgi:hypothetical protein
MRITNVKSITMMSMLIALETGCATIVSDSNYLVSMNSTPTDAEFLVRNQDGVEVHKGRTPSTLSLRAGAGYFDGETYEVAFHKNGYADATHTLDSGVDPWYVGNLLFGGLIGFLIVDPATGAMFNLPDNMQVSLGDPLAAPLADEQDYQPASSATALVQEPLDEP